MIALCQCVCPSKPSKPSLIFTSKTTGNRGLEYKTFWICNARKMDTLCSKLVPLFSSITFTSLDKNTLFYYIISALQICNVL